MRDINFFSQYIDKKKVQFNNKFFLTIFFLIFSILILGYSIINQWQVNKLSKASIELKEVAENPETLKKVEAIKKEEEELNKIKLEIESIKDLKNSIKEKDFIGSAYIDEIINKRPNDLFLTSLNISPENISITGISNNKLNIAEFTKGLKTVNKFENILVSNITKEEIDYKFELISNFPEEEVENGSDDEGNKEKK